MAAATLWSPDTDTRMRGSGGGSCPARTGRKRGEKGRATATGDVLYNGMVEGAGEGVGGEMRPCGRKGVGGGG
jgi:hypothetical protein